MNLLQAEAAKINKGKQDKMYNTETMLPISEIQQDTIILKDNGLRGIIKVGGVNIDLKNGDEIELILEQYKKFLNWLDFPVQILIRNTYLDLTPYITYVKGNITAIENGNLKEQATEYVWFLEKINLKQGLIFVKEFYVVVPFYESLSGDVDNVNKPRWAKMLAILDAGENAEKIVGRYRGFVKNNKKLATRCNLIVEWLRSLRMEAERIWLSDIISLLFSCYNPTVQKSQGERDEERREKI